MRRIAENIYEHNGIQAKAEHIDNRTPPVCDECPWRSECDAQAINCQEYIGNSHVFVEIKENSMKKSELSFKCVLGSPARNKKMEDEMNKQLAKITSAKLEIQDRGILSFWILVDYEGGGSQGIGDIALDTYDADKGKRVGAAYGCEVIRRLLLALGVNDFSEMKGNIIWVLGVGAGLSFKPKGIKRLDINGGGDAVVFDEIAAEFGLREE